jgi:hypothetical protein
MSAVKAAFADDRDFQILGEPARVTDRDFAFTGYSSRSTSRMSFSHASGTSVSFKGITVSAIVY